MASLVIMGAEVFGGANGGVCVIILVVGIGQQENRMVNLHRPKLFFPLLVLPHLSETQKRCSSSMQIGWG